MKWIARRIWSTSSFVITLGHIAIIYGISEHLYRQGIRFDHVPHLESEVATFHLYAIGTGALVGIVGAIRERPPYYGLLAMLFSSFSFFVFNG
jgi:hypothetical protein